jgi:hypothetical protein
MMIAVAVEKTREERKKTKKPEISLARFPFSSGGGLHHRSREEETKKAFLS